MPVTFTAIEQENTIINKVCLLLLERIIIEKKLPDSWKCALIKESQNVFDRMVISGKVEYKQLTTQTVRWGTHGR